MKCKFRRFVDSDNIFLNGINEIFMKLVLPIVQVIPTQPQLEIEKEPTVDIQPTVEPMTSKPRSVPIPDSFRTCVDVRSKEMKIPPLPKEASSTSLCTSTIKLPCYYAENLDSLDIARYLFQIHYGR